jgi:hypothetical protein
MSEKCHGNALLICCHTRFAFASLDYGIAHLFSSWIMLAYAENITKLVLNSVIHSSSSQQPFG